MVLRAFEPRAALRHVGLPGGGVSLVGDVVHQRVEQLRGLRGHGLRFQEAVIEVVELSVAHRLRVAVRQVGLADEDLGDTAAAEHAHGPDAAVA
jgi:hypothetical protein